MVLSCWEFGIGDLGQKDPEEFSLKEIEFIMQIRIISSPIIITLEYIDSILSTDITKLKFYKNTEKN